MIQINNLTKHFGDFVAVDNLSMSLQPGDILGFLGPNGAGKSTSMKMITGFLEASAGTVEIDGQDIVSNSIELKQKIGYLPEGAPAYGDMTVAQFLDFIADVRGLKGDYKAERLKHVVSSVEIESVLQKHIDTLSKGFKRRVGLAQAIMHDPKVLILDEPTDGLDPNQKHQVRKLIQNLSADKIVIVSTHILEEVTAVCNRAVIIAGGKKLFDGTPQELEAKSRHQKAITIEFSEIPDLTAVEGHELVAEVQKDETHQAVTVIPKEQEANLFNALFELAKSGNWPVTGMYAEKGRLDDVFRKLTAEV
ncbi:multidrug ABC transporter ATP-binding protein [Saccharobesus litoralis]|uniref:Multidrug ABC transporter ATP-binding protein n=1 Tax=Saccharobesus litoralis TaxID=2172099 RepID=A0A2S0VV77_9ALTE|nr:ATP-binding cassette domain-containing protein [Saccharobesus litoralis]AWB68105.1 multidrug ABC transporter ATP-binding protein [Saccharobesus litoralis]